MEKLTRPLTIALVLLCAGVVLQAQGVHEGMLRFQGTLALGVVNSSDELRYYVYGESEYLVDDHIGINGAVYAQLGSSINEFPDDVAPQGGDYAVHSLFTGPAYHFRPDSPLDVYVAFQPGLHLTHSPQVVYPLGLSFQEAWTISPAASLNFGVAYYGSFFHLFGQLRAVTGQNLKSGIEYGIMEWRPTFGLGFNLF